MDIALELAAFEVGEHGAAHVTGLGRYADDRDRARPDQAVEARRRALRIHSAGSAELFCAMMSRKRWGVLANGTRFARSSLSWRLKAPPRRPESGGPRRSPHEETPRRMASGSS